MLSLLFVSLWCVWLQLGVVFAGKIPKLYTEVEVSSQRDLYLSENPGAVPESPGRSSLQVAARNPTTMKPPKNTRAGEWSQQSDEEHLGLGLFIPLDKCDWYSKLWNCEDVGAV